jgi:hypothetical protein
MNAVVGTLLIALVVLGFTVMVLATRKPNPPAWSSYTLVHEFVAICCVSMGSFGIALVVESMVLLKQQPLNAMHVILIALVLVVFAAAWKRLRVRGWGTPPRKTPIHRRVRALPTCRRKLPEVPTRFLSIRSCGRSKPPLNMDAQTRNTSRLIRRLPVSRVPRPSVPGC